MRGILKRLSYSVFANLCSLLAGVLTVLILPRYMDVADYGVYQLFLFYASYIGFFHFGWIDGIYLRYGGAYIEQLDAKLFSGQFKLLLLFTLAEAIFVNILLSFVDIEDRTLLFVLRTVSVLAVFVQSITFVNFVLQLTNCIKEYARNVLLERALITSALVLCVLAGCVGFANIIYAYVLAVIIAAVLIVSFLRELLSKPFADFSGALREAGRNIGVGSKLMLSNVAGMLLLGIIRFAVSRSWDMATFAKLSLSLSISNFMMIFISAVSVVLFPTLKRIKPEKLKETYFFLRQGLTFVLLGLLISYYPLKELLGAFLPKYKDSLLYMGYLMPICIFESKMQMLVTTYLKSLRQEALLFKINFISVAVAIVSTYFSVVVLHYLTLTVLSIVFNFAFRAVLAEYILGKVLFISFSKKIFVRQ